MSFDPYNHILKIWESIRTPTPKVGTHFGSVEVHSLTLSHTPGSMKCDSRASLLACTFASPYFGCDLKFDFVVNLVWLIRAILITISSRYIECWYDNQQVDQLGMCKWKQIWGLNMYGVHGGWYGICTTLQHLFMGPFGLGTYLITLPWLLWKLIHNFDVKF
jgi:hypothetical protein